MASDPRKLRPSELCRLLNSTPLGEVISEQLLRRHRTRAGLRIGDDRHVDLLRYVAWLVQVRHAPKPQPDSATPSAHQLAEAAQGAAAIGGMREQMKGHGQKFTRKQEALIAALLTEPTYAAAAAKAGVSEATVYRWKLLPDFREAYRSARRELVEAAVGRIQAATGQAVDVLLDVALRGKRDADRLRAAVAVFDRACRALTDADVLHGKGSDDPSPMDTGEVVRILAARMRQVEESDLPTAEKSRLTARLADATLRAIGVDTVDKRLEALEAVLNSRKDKQA